MADVQIITFGCRLNAFESDVMASVARAAGLRDAIIINTCAVTAEAQRQARQAIRRARREHPKKRIIVTGCAAQLAPADFAAMEEVDRVLGNAEKLDGIHLAGTDPVRVSAVSRGPVAVPLVDGPEDRARAFVQVQQGCDHRCTFCIIPFARGPNRSLPIAAIVRQAEHLVDAGFAELVLTGIDIASYGADLPGRPTLGAMAGRLLEAVPGLRRLRLSSLDPAAVDRDLIGLLAAEPRLMPHVHLSLQAADDMVLKRMKRRHTRAGVRDLCRRLRLARPDVVFGADLIAGFPTESAAMFENTLSAVDELGLTYLHVFPFSPRPGTPAERMPQVPGDVRKERAARLRAAGESALDRFLKSRVGHVAPVLVEGTRLGRCPHYAPVRLAFDAPPGRVVEVYIDGVAGRQLTARKAA